MNNFLNKLYKPIVIYIYILLLPITEIITTYMLRVLKTPITLGMIYKPLFLLYAGIYLIFVDKKNKKSNYIYIGIMAIYMAIYICVTTEMNFSILNREIIGYIMTYLYLPVILMFLYRYYNNGNKLGQKILVYSGSIYAITMLMAYVSNTQIKIYGNLGQSGWFNAANELGAIFGIIYPVLLFYTFENKKIIDFVLLGICTWAIISIGSRVSFLALGITIFVFVIYSLVKAIINIKNKNSSVAIKRGSWALIITSIILVIGIVIYYPYSPFAQIWENRKIEVASRNNKGV